MLQCRWFGWFLICIIVIVLEINIKFIYSLVGIQIVRKNIYIPYKIYISNIIYIKNLIDFIQLIM